MGAGVLALAFDRAAEAYDRDFGTNAAGLLFRQVVQRRLLALTRAGARVLDLGCGTGEDALFLAEHGRRVHAVDLSPAMLRRCRDKAAQRGLGPDRLAIEERAAEDLASLPAQCFDAAFSDFGVLNCADLGAAGRGLEHVLRPGAAVLLSVMAARPLPATLARALLGRGQARGASAPRVGGLAVPVHHPSPRRLRAALGSAFIWERAYALGVVVPGPDRGAWPARHPLAFATLAAVDRLVGGWPLLRGHGDHLVLEGRRR